MFAFGVWDRKERELHLVRDRCGEKPLYYGWNGDAFLFGSELKALLAYPGFEAMIDRDALVLYLRYGYISAPHSIYRGIFKLLPGTILTIADVRPGEVPEPRPYWSAAKHIESGLEHPFIGSDEDAIVQLEDLLRDAVGQQMQADVPLGAFLSGGIDSSLVVALMQSLSGRPVRTFTIGFDEARFNEANHARAVAARLGTEHTETYVRPAEAMGVLPKLASIYDEPFADSSQIPTLLVSQLAKQFVTVSLSGDGGDELFAGYNWYTWTQTLWKRLGCLPRGVRSAIASICDGLSPMGWDRLLTLVSPTLPRGLRGSISGDRVYKLAALIRGMENPMSVYEHLVARWHDSSSVVLGTDGPLTTLGAADLDVDQNEIITTLLYVNFADYLPNDILTKVDRSTMAVSLESRAPLLDHRIVEFASRLPMSMKLRNGQSKWLLRQVLYRHVPRKMVDRPKSGFSIPIDSWLRGPLRDWAEHLLDENRMRQEGFLDPGIIRRTWNEHLSGQRKWQHKIWCVLMFQAWMEDRRMHSTNTLNGRATAEGELANANPWSH